jgi:hypothetical protein
MQRAHSVLRRYVIFSAVVVGVLPLRAYSQPTQSTTPMRTATRVKIRIVVGDKTIPVTLDDNASARDFAALLPLTLTLEDYAATEKIATLSRKLSVAGAPAGMTPQVGDFCYYAPWGNLAIFHKAFNYSAGLVRLGRVESGIEVLRVEGSMSARIEPLPR